MTKWWLIKLLNGFRGIIFGKEWLKLLRKVPVLLMITVLGRCPNPHRSCQSQDLATLPTVQFDQLVIDISLKKLQVHLLEKMKTEVIHHLALQILKKVVKEVQHCPSLKVILQKWKTFLKVNNYSHFHMIIVIRQKIIIFSRAGKIIIRRPNLQLNQTPRTSTKPLSS